MQISVVRSCRFLAFAALSVLSVTSVFAISDTEEGLDPFNCNGNDACNRNALHDFANSNKKLLGYDKARLNMFQEIDVYEDSAGNRVVDSVYSSDVLVLPPSGIPDGEFNTEHSWPQSYLKKYGNFEATKSDVYHLFPVEIRVNSARGNMPFAECSDSRGLATQGRKSTICKAGFEPPDSHKGVLSRAMFYMSVTYNMAIDAKQERLFRKWNNEFPVDEREKVREERIISIQGNRNPFIEYPEWANLVQDF